MDHNPIRVDSVEGLLADNTKVIFIIFPSYSEF